MLGSGPSKRLCSEGRRDDEDDSFRRICLKPPSSMPPTRDSELVCPWCEDGYSMPSYTAPNNTPASRASAWVLKVCEAVRFMLCSKVRGEGALSSAAEEVLGRCERMEVLRCCIGAEENAVAGLIWRWVVRSGLGRVVVCLATERETSRERLFRISRWRARTEQCDVTGLYISSGCSTAGA